MLKMSKREGTDQNKSMGSMRLNTMEDKKEAIIIRKKP